VKYTRSVRLLVLSTVLLLGVVNAAGRGQTPAGTTAFVNGRVLTDTPGRALTFADAVILVRDGRIESVRPAAGGKPPADARVVDLGGRFVTPGFISAHAHVSDVNGLKPRAYTDENTRRQLGVFARYGITTVWSLGGEQAPAFALRDAQAGPALDRARIFVAGDVITGRTPDEARAAVARVAALKPDVIKIRVDDNLGTATKMTPEVYRAVIEEAHARKLRVAAHIFYLADAKDLVKSGVDVIAHSVRDVDVDAEFLSLMKERGVAYCPTLTREVSAFVYESTPAFFADPFFLREADRDVMAQFSQPDRQKAMASSATAQRYKAGLEIAKRNLKRAADAGVTIAMGTDSGAFPERFQGYFEHLEMEMMVASGMTPAQVVRSATSDAAAAMKRQDIGAIAAGKWADFVVLDKDPLADIKNTRAIASVWIAGRQIDR
jgi:imidazolonepropionase-like amidohydrolase